MRDLVVADRRGRQRQETVHFVAAEEIEADRTLSRPGRAGGRPAGPAGRRAAGRAARAARLPTALSFRRHRARTARAANRSEPFFAHERHEPTGYRAQDRWAFRAANDDLEPLDAVLADGHDEAAARLQLLVEGLRQLRCRCGDCDRIERRALGQSARAVADVDADAVVAGGCEVRARELGELGDALDRVAPRRRARPAPLPDSRSPCRRRARARGPFSASASQIRATMYGCEIVWPPPIGSAASS